MSFLICEDGTSRVVVDRTSRMVRFERCHARWSWLWPRRVSEEFVCPLDDIIAVHLFRRAKHDNNVTGAAVVTQHGRALLPLTMNGCRELVDLLQAECEGRGSGSWCQNPNYETLAVLGLLTLGFGGFAVWVRLFSGWAAR